MLEAIKYSTTGESLGKIELPETLFTHEAKNPEAVLYEVITLYMANQRQGTSSTKGRSEVKGSSRKLFRQKGTGNARMGNVRTPVRVGGGNAFGPKPKDWFRPIPKKKKRLALKIALSEKAKAGNVFVIEDLNYDKPNTKMAISLLEKVVPERGNKLVLMNDSNSNIIKSFSNIMYVSTDRADSLYAYEVMKAKYLIFTESALKRAEEVFNG
ncbi:MAG: 50S ribosomal protein L4 [Candidatus Cloacimonetes bacterium]|nr:50S ribosomal protein L4 [Candidatus Cloacimonadota bacterium]